MKTRTRVVNHSPSDLWLCIGLGVLILIFYWNSFTAGLLFDSDSIIKMDPRLRGLNWINLQNILTRNYWWPNDEGTLYRPLTTLTYLFNYSILENGENVAGYHAVNFLLHWANAWLVVLITRRLTGRIDLAALTAGLFAVHPVNTEAVTNVVGRADLLATLCVLFAGWCYLRGSIVLMGVAACVGVLAKENAIMIVPFVVLYDLFWRKGNEFSWRAYAALLPAVLLFGIIRLWITSTTMAFEELFLDNPLIGAAPLQRLMTAIGIIGRYLKLLVFPRTLSADYSFSQIPIDVSWAAVAVIALLLAAAIYLRTRQKLFSWGVIFFFVMLLPTSNLVVSIGSIMAERFLYLPSIGICAAASVVLYAIGGKLRNRWVLPIVVIFALGVRTMIRNSDWQDPLVFAKSTVDASPASFKAHMFYGDEVVADAQRKSQPLEAHIDEAIREEEIARSIVEPQPPLPLKWQNLNVYLRLGEYYRVKGDYEKSLAALKKAEEIDRFTNQVSREFKMRRGIRPEEIADIGNAVVYESLCLTYAKLQTWDECVAAARYLEHIAPQQAEGYQLAGAALFNSGKYADAAVQFLAGFLIDPDNPAWLQNLSATYENLGVQPNPIMASGTSFSLNRNVPLVQEQLNEAAALLSRKS